MILIRNQAGATYLMVLMVVMVMGVMLGMTGQAWKQVMQREREAELLFRGMQIQQALDRWHNPRQGQPPASKLTDLKYLLRDPRSVANFKYLRKLYTDPITNADWKLVLDPARGIVGVASSSPLTPIKQANFPDELKDLAGKEKYSDWVFGYKPVTAGLPAAATTGLPAAQPPIKK